LQNLKLIITDLDRTLLNSDKKISDYSKKVLTECRSRGLKLAFATARPKRTIYPFLGNLEIDALIEHNGAGVYIGEKLISCYVIPPDTKDQVVLDLQKIFPSSKISVEIGDINYANFDLPKEWHPYIKTDFTNLPPKSANKILLGISNSDDIKKLSAYIPAGLYFEISENILAMIMNKNAKKWTAVKAAANYFNIKTTEIVAFGDDYNDIEMLKQSGAGVAVLNAIPEAKAAADFITDTNDNNGVASWLEANVLSL